MKVIPLLLVLLVYTHSFGEVTNTRNIAVNSIGYVYAEPDRMSLSIHVNTEGDNLKELKRLNDESSEQVYQILDDHEIPPENIRSSGITFRTGYKKDDPPYITNNVITFHTEELEIYPELMDQLVGIQFVIVKETDLYASNHSELEQEATKLALLDARNKAASMLAVYDESLGEVLRISEGFIYSRGTNVDYFAAPAKSNSSTTSRINTGKIEIKKEIGVIFKIKDKQ